MRRRNVVAFNHLAELPAGDEIGNAAIFLNTTHNDFGHQLALAADEEFAIGYHALILTDVQHNEIPFGIHANNLAMQIRGQFYKLIRPDEFF